MTKRKLISFNLRKAILERDNYSCQICGNTNKDQPLEIDHIIPVNRGGTNDFDNLVVLCRRCNREKSDNLVRVPIKKNILQQEIDKEIIEKKKNILYNLSQNDDKHKEKFKINEDWNKIEKNILNYTPEIPFNIFSSIKKKHFSGNKKDCGMTCKQIMKKYDEQTIRTVFKIFDI